MMDAYAVSSRKREYPRVPVEAFCTELHDERLRHAIAVDLSEDGLRIQRPIGGKTPRRLQLELEIPEVDEVVWALGEIRFDEVWSVPPAVTGGRPGIIRTSGIRVVSAAERHRRMLREYVMDTWRQMQAQVDEALLLASCYRNG
jgi:hypothetical protein